MLRCYFLRYLNWIRLLENVVLSRLVGMQLVSSIVSCSASRLFTLVRLVHIVSPLMIISVATGRKTLIAEFEVATIGFLSVVHPYMLLKITPLVE